jgi:hypothetical protein
MYYRQLISARVSKTLRLTIIRWYAANTIIFLTILLFCVNNHSVGGASSPSFVRQEVIDSGNDRIFIIYPDKALRENETEQLNNLIQNFTRLSTSTTFIDMTSISYYSSGDTIYATVWLNGSLDHFNNTLNIDKVSYGMLIDADSNSKTGLEGIDYLVDVQNNTSSGWGILLSEWSSTENHAEVETADTTPQTSFASNEYVHFALDLDKISTPSKYKIMFYAIGTYPAGRILDFTNWIDIPPEEYHFVTFPNDPALVRQGEERDITAQLRSTTSFVPQVSSFAPILNESNLNIKFVGNGENDAPYGLEPAPFRVSVPSQIPLGTYSIPMLANIPTETTFPKAFSFIDLASLVPSQGHSVARAVMTLNVMAPLTFSEWFAEGWKIYGDFIGFVGGGFAAGLSALAIEKIRERRNQGKKMNRA